MKFERNIILCVTGGIAAFKAVLLLRLLTKAGASVRVVMTEAATRFVGPLTFEALSDHPVHLSLWGAGGAGGETHISLTDQADLIAVVPATAHTLARMAQGMADDLVGATVLAANCPVLVAPAMHARMYAHPATQANLALLKARGVTVVEPVVGALAKGQGMGRLADPEDIFQALVALATPKDLQGKRLLVTAGPTVEALDPVRFISNHSSGKMGYAIATEACRRGAEVTLLSGPVALPCPAGVTRVSITSAAELHAAVEAHKTQADVIVMAAAVADYAPSLQAEHKIKKSGENLTITLKPTVDILAGLGAWRRQLGARRPLLVGFAMETEALETHAAEKLRRKGCDLMVANHLLEPGAGFKHDTNRVTLLDAEGGVERLPLLSKQEVAGILLDRINACLAKSPQAGPADLEVGGAPDKVDTAVQLPLLEELPHD